MKLIAHRGLVNGPDSQLENHPAQIANVLDQALDAEIDVWFKDSVWWLGHDNPTHEISFSFLSHPQLWIHAKNFEAADQLITLSRQGHSHNFFWHDKDDRTLTSWGFWWTYPGRELSKNSVAVMPEWHTPKEEFHSLLSLDCHAVCTDWINLLK